jgi:thiamine-phosphate pyrophosphorylase
VTVVQLREPTAPDDEVVRLGRALVAQLVGTGVPLIVNDRVHLVADIGAAGAHVGQHDLSPAEVRRRLGSSAVVGVSVQTPAHVDALRALPPGTVDYVGVGPVWPQTTKADAAPAGGVAVLAAISAASPWPCVAIGGVTVARLAAARAAGAAGVAVVSAICGRPDPAEATRWLRKAWDGADPAPAAAAPTRPSFPQEAS